MARCAALALSKRFKIYATFIFMKVMFVLLLSCYSLVSFSQAQKKTSAVPGDTDSIFWSPGRKLQAGDYKGAPETGSRFGAVSIFPIICNYETDSTSHDLQFHVYAYFDRNASWIKPENKNDPDLLSHEQVHFDIVEVYVRIIKQRIREYQQQGKKKEADYVQLVNTLLDEEEETQRRYDEETDLSRNEVQQKLWAAKVGALLKTKAIRQFK